MAENRRERDVSEKYEQTRRKYRAVLDRKHRAYDQMVRLEEELRKAKVAQEQVIKETNEKRAEREEAYNDAKYNYEAVRSGKNAWLKIKLEAAEAERIAIDDYRTRIEEAQRVGDDASVRRFEAGVRSHGRKLKSLEDDIQALEVELNCADMEFETKRPKTKTTEIDTARKKAESIRKRYERSEREYQRLSREAERLLHELKDMSDTADSR